VWKSSLRKVTESTRDAPGGSLDSYTGQVETKKPVTLSREYEAFLNRPHTAAVLTLYPDRSAEITGCHMLPASGRPTIPSTEEEKRNRVIRRARRKVRMLTRFNQCRYLWTLGRRGGFSTYRDTLSAWKKFARRLKKHYPEFGAVAIPELHRGGGVNDGTFHIHFATDQFIEVAVARSVWHSVVGFNAEGSPMGNVDAQAPPSGKFTASHIANYLMKYVIKQFGDDVLTKFQHRYWVTKNFCPPDLNRPENRKLKFGIRSLVDYRGASSAREARLMGLIFFLTGKKSRVVWRSEEGRDFRIETVEVDDGDSG
jgi:hypothetical protein